MRDEFAGAQAAGLHIATSATGSLVARPVSHLGKNNAGLAVQSGDFLVDRREISIEFRNLTRVVRHERTPVL